MSPRSDVSAVPLQGGYIAKQCPVVIQNRILVPAAEAAVPLEVQARMSAGIEYEQEVLEDVRVADDDGDWVIIPTGPREVAQEQTLQAMTDGIPVIEQAFLPADTKNRRTGRPDLLVKAEGGYVPVDIKHHRVLDPDEGSLTVSDPRSPFPGALVERLNSTLRRHSGDAMQLAHYRRMLEALGFESATNLGGVLGKEGVIVWYDLDEPMWTTPAKSDGKKRKKRSSMERYDFEFGFRLDIAAVALESLDDPDLELLVEPMSCGECDTCGFRSHCFATLTVGSGDASLLPGLSYPQWRTLRDAGIVERKHVAALHYSTAELVANGVDVEAFFGLAVGTDKRQQLKDLRPRATKQLEILDRSGLKTVEDFENAVDPLTASIGGFVAPRILDARAALGEEAVYRRPGAAGDAVPRADIEIDIDMENVNEGVYLWGTYLTDRTQSSRLDEGYRPFVSWEDIDEVGELEILEGLYDWLDDIRQECSRLALTWRAYVWHESAENTQLRRIAAGGGTAALERVESLIASDSWVDLKAVFEESWITGTSTGLKTIAPLAGHEWTVDDPGGGLSMIKYEEAIGDDEQVAGAARTWLLEYNRGDVLATKTIREWLDTHGASWPEVDTN